MTDRPTEQDGRQALRDHLLEKACPARARYGPSIGADEIVSILSDREVVRYPTVLRFDDTNLMPGEFAHAEAVGEHPADGFCLYVHPCFEPMRDVWPLLIAYHIPPINYGEIVEAEDCEVFGAALLGLETGAYYAKLCELADLVPLA